MIERPSSRSSRALLALGALLAVAAVPTVALADIYHWKDADGVDHFTNRPTASPGAKVYLKGGPAPTPAGANTVRPGVTPFAPQDRDPGRYTRFDEYIRQALRDLRDAGVIAVRGAGRGATWHRLRK